MNTWAGAEQRVAARIFSIFEKAGHREHLEIVRVKLMPLGSVINRVFRSKASDIKRVFGAGIGRRNGQGVENEPLPIGFSANGSDIKRAFSGRIGCQISGELKMHRYQSGIMASAIP